MAWDEWEQIKADVTGRQPVAMRLNQAAAEPGPSAGGATGTLKSSRKAWATAGEGIGSLRGNIRTALSRLEDGQAGLGEVTGCLSAAAQKDVYSSWRKYARSVGERCGTLQKLLEQAGNDQLTTDEAVKGELDKLKQKYADTDAVGGQDKGR
ncbi:hypothetical protein ACFYXM_13445 [Streptomyces sp. NPDC002476]|uniref:hypothetical protein n=1 Tax=Streptomyces sp. NPDC002476 TaxID=3364648 RepID=UPI0036CC8926